MFFLILERSDLSYYLDYVVIVHRMHGEQKKRHYLSIAVIYHNEIVVSYTEAVDRYPLLKLHISTEP